MGTAHFQWPPRHSLGGLGNIFRYKPVVTLFEMWRREADIALADRALMAAYPAGVDGIEFVLWSSWVGWDDEVSDNGENRDSRSLPFRGRAVLPNFGWTVAPFPLNGQPRNGGR